mgnify:CR=1 FL=1
MLKGILEAALTAQQRQAGLHLDEDEVLATFSAVGATMASIREEAEKHIAE